MPDCMNIVRRLADCLRESALQFYSSKEELAQEVHNFINGVGTDFKISST
jgi:hypothetical protein